MAVRNSKESISKQAHTGTCASLEERVRRMTRCDISDPAFSEWVMKKLCGVKVTGELRRFRYSKYADTLEAQCVRNFSKNPDDICMGDLAALVTEWYLEGAENIPREIRVYLAAFLMVIDGAVDKVRAEEAFTRRHGRVPVDVSGKRWDYALEFLRIPLTDIMEMIAVSVMPPLEKEGIMDFVSQEGWTDFVSLYDIYDDLSVPPSAGEYEGCSMATLLMSENGAILRENPGTKGLLNLIRLMVMPLAFMAACGQGSMQN